MTVSIENTYTGDGTTTNRQFTFPYLDTTDIKVSLDGVAHTNFRLHNATTVQFVNNTTDNIPTAPANGVAIRIYRETAYENPKATFYPGSAIRAGDLNDNTLQNLYVTQEANDKVNDAWLTGDPTVISTESWYTTDDTKIASTKAIENRIAAKIGTALKDDVVGGTAVTITDDSPSANKITVKVTDGGIDTTQLANSAVTTAKISATAGIEFTKLENLDSAKILVGNSSNKAAEVSMSGDVAISNTGATTIQSGAVERGMLAADVIDGTKIDDDAVDSEHIAAGAIDTEHIAAAQVTLAKIENVADTKIIVGNGSNRPTAVSVSGDVTIANTGAVTIANDAITASKIDDDAVTTDHIADAELVTLAGMPSATASILADSTALTATTAELNLLDNKTFRASGDGSLTTTSDTEIPSSKVIAAHVSSTILATGGFISINNEVSFPTTANQPANGVIVSISDAAGTVVNGSGTSTTGRTTDGTPATVTINNFPSSLNGETLASGVGMLVTSTGSGNIYNYHKILAAETDVKSLSDDINDFNARYRVASSAPGSNNDDGDLYFDTTANKMKVYNATTSTWDDVASVGNFFINTLSSSSNTGGGSATFNGSAYRFTLSNPPTMAQQLIVSVNGVIQKPNSGSSQPSEGFAISGNDIIFAAAPASSSDYFIVTQGSSVSIGTPSDNTVATAKLQNLSVTNDKIANDTIAEGKLDIHNAAATGKLLKYTSNGMEWSAAEGADVLSTGESSSTKYLGTDGDGTCSWKTTNFVQTDNASAMSGQLELTLAGSFPLKINNNNNAKIDLGGSDNPYIQFKEATTNKAEIAWSTDGYLKLNNSEDGSQIRLKDNFEFSNDGTTFHPVLTSASTASSLTSLGTLASLTVSGNSSFTGQSDFTGHLKEAVTITAGKLSDNLNLDIENGNVFLFTTAESTTALPNIRYNGSTTLDSKMSVGDCLSVTIITTANASGFSAQLTIDGNAVTENWIGGSAPDSGGSSGVDIHAYTIIKTATDTYTVIANHTTTS